ncbi:MAG TPA: glycerophosphodiester phosphodiesterase family protein [Clostridia bacterium]|nr:glycerophosphodiester phosphodiesterase family protein [Clostridia bacterium]
MKQKHVLVIALFIIMISAVITTAVLCFINKHKQDIKVTATISVSDLSLPEKPIDLISHRGLTTDAPENSLESIALSGEKGYCAVEFDIRQTIDGVWVLSHDDNIKRMTNGKGKISKMTYREILEYSLDNGNGIEENSDIKITTLSQALNACLTHTVKPYIEVKSFNEGGIENLYNLVHDKSVLENIAIISFDGNVVQKFNELSPKTEIWLLTSKLDKNAFEFVKNNPQIGLSFNGNLKKNTAQKITELMDDEIKLCAWTIDDKATFEKLIDIGITTFTTNVFIP